MFKKAVTCVLCAASIQQAVAGVKSKDEPSFSLFSTKNETPYIGGSAGYSSSAGKSGRIFGGYSGRYGKDKKLSIAKEANLDVFQMKNYNFNNRLNYGLGASILPGYYVTDSTIVYGRLGAEVIKSSGSLGFTPQYGAGIQQSINKKVDVRAEYISFGSHNTYAPNNSVTAGLSYKFD